MDTNQDVSKLTLEQKIKLTRGQGAWHTNAIGDIPSITMSDGPHGLRKQNDKNDGINDSVKATCFPCACAVASSFNRQNARLVAEAVAEEAVAENVDIVLGPGINIKRSPLCGRNFEYFSEDPLLAGELAVSYVNGMQSKGVGCSLKHFAVNSQESRRMTVNAVVDERALREIYLSAFERVIKQAQPYTVMAAYNKINGVSATQNKKLLTDVLRTEWGFEGLVVSDWGAAYDMGAAYAAGMDLEMPDGGFFHEGRVVNALDGGTLQLSDLDRACQNVIKLVNKCRVDKEKPADGYMEKHHELARRVAVDSAVLLKNDGILPLDKKAKILVVGELAEKPRFQGSGSSHVNSKCQSFLKVLKDNGVDFAYKRGYNVKGDEPDVKLEESAVNDVSQYDVVLFFGGLTDDFEGEGYDRAKLDIPYCQQRLLKRLHTVNPSIVFVAFGGSAFVTTGWLDYVNGLLNMYLGGQAVTEAAYDLLFGDVSPSGRLAETFPVLLKNTPCYNYFANNRHKDEHRESIFVGYRYYNTYGVVTRYPFGYGLSYAKFDYSDFSVRKQSDGTYEASVKITNSGGCNASEVVQIYVDNCDCGYLRAKRELRAFDKVYIPAGKSVTVKLPLDDRSFSIFLDGKFVQVAGKYRVCVCRNVEEVISSVDIDVDGAQVEGRDRELYPSFFNQEEDTFTVNEDEFYQLARQQNVDYVKPRRGQFTLLNTFEDMRNVRLVRLIVKIAAKIAEKQSPTKSLSDPVAQMIIHGAMETPLISLMSVGGIPTKYIMFILHHVNKRRFKALKALLGIIEM